MLLSDVDFGTCFFDVLDCLDLSSLASNFSAFSASSGFASDLSSGLSSSSVDFSASSILSGASAFSELSVWPDSSSCLDSTDERDLTGLFGLFVELDCLAACEGRRVLCLADDSGGLYRTGGDERLLDGSTRCLARLLLAGGSEESSSSSNVARRPSFIF